MYSFREHCVIMDCILCIMIITLRGEQGIYHARRHTFFFLQVQSRGTLSNIQQNIMSLYSDNYLRVESLYLLTNLFVLYLFHIGDRGSSVVKAICYKSEGR